MCRRQRELLNIALLTSTQSNSLWAVCDHDFCWLAVAHRQTSKPLADTSASRHSGALRRRSQHFDTSAVIEEKPGHFDPGQFGWDTAPPVIRLNFGTNFVVPKCLVAEVSGSIQSGPHLVSAQHNRCSSDLCSIATHPAIQTFWLTTMQLSATVSVPRTGQLQEGHRSRSHSCSELSSCPRYFGTFSVHFPKTFKTASLSTLLPWPCPLNYLFFLAWSLW